MIERWQRRFIKKLFHYDRRMLDIEGAQTLKDANLPKVLYKFRSFDAAHLDALTRGVLYRSPPQAFNDPFDSAAYIKSDMVTRRMTLEGFEETSGRKGDPRSPKFYNDLEGGRSMEEASRNLLKGAPEIPADQVEPIVMALMQSMRALETEMVDGLNNQIRSGTSVLSLSDAINSILMWSHYGNSHSGFAVAYHIENLPQLHPFRRACFPVVYSQKPRNMSRFIFGDNTNNLWLTYASMLKFSDWSYEREWRLIFPLGPEQSQAEILTPPPVHIYVGANASAVDLAYMGRFCEGCDIPLSQMRLERSTGSLIAERHN